jgi:hypothetical protein
MRALAAFLSSSRQRSSSCWPPAIALPTWGCALDAARAAPSADTAGGGLARAADDAADAVARGGGCGAELSGTYTKRPTNVIPGGGHQRQHGRDGKIDRTREALAAFVEPDSRRPRPRGHWWSSPAAPKGYVPLAAMDDGNRRAAAHAHSITVLEAERRHRAARRHLCRRHRDCWPNEDDGGAINAIVVMTDGQENESFRSLAEIQDGCWRSADNPPRWSSPSALGRTPTKTCCRRAGGVGGRSVPSRRRDGHRRVVPASSRLISSVRGGFTTEAQRSHRDCTGSRAALSLSLSVTSANPLRLCGESPHQKRSMTTTRSDIQKRAQSAIWQYAIFRWESALVIALTLVLFFPGAAAFCLVAALRLAGVGAGGAGGGDLLQPDRRRGSNATRGAAALPRAVRRRAHQATSELRKDVETALEYQRRIEMQVREQKRALLRERLERDGQPDSRSWVEQHVRAGAAPGQSYRRDDLLEQQREHAAPSRSAGDGRAAQGCIQPH